MRSPCQFPCNLSSLQCLSSLESRISLTSYSVSPSICSGGGGGGGCCQRGMGWVMWGLGVTCGRLGRVKLMWKAEGDGVGTWFPYHVIWAQVLFQEFLGWSL